ncbi:hypothetical protein [Streptomyces sp. NPDC093261]
MSSRREVTSPAARSSARSWEAAATHASIGSARRLTGSSRSLDAHSSR